jgi:hypothetical protein
MQTFDTEQYKTKKLDHFTLNTFIIFFINELAFASFQVEIELFSKDLLTVKRQYEPIDRLFLE